MPEKMLELCPVLGEFMYVKMLVAMTLNALNKQRAAVGRRMVAIGQLDAEQKQIRAARTAYDLASCELKMHSFVYAYTRITYFSMIAYPVGMHHDHFHDGESLEGKMVFSIAPPENESLGRGGSVLGRLYVYALTNWN